MCIRYKELRIDKCAVSVAFTSPVDAVINLEELLSMSFG